MKYKLTAKDMEVTKEFGFLLSHNLETIAQLDGKTKKLITIAESDINGQCFRALRDIDRGEWVASAFGILIGHQTQYHSVQESMGVHIEPFEYGGKYINHSCEGNLIVRSDERGITQFLASQNIKKGEELTYPYALTEFTWSAIASENDIACNCQVPKCEGVIKAFDMLKPEKQEKLVKNKVVSSYLVQWFNQQKT